MRGINAALLGLPRHVCRLFFLLQAVVSLLIAGFGLGAEGGIGQFFGRHGFQHDAIDWTRRQAQAAAGAIVGQHGVQFLVRPDNGIDGARLNAQGAANAPVGHDARHGGRRLRDRQGLRRQV